MTSRPTLAIVEEQETFAPHLNLTVQCLVRPEEADNLGASGGLASTSLSTGRGKNRARKSGTSAGSLSDSSSSVKRQMNVSASFVSIKNKIINHELSESVIELDELIQLLQHELKMVKVRPRAEKLLPQDQKVDFLSLKFWC
ncbi:hypothetical protein HUJ05_003791 [Dendroctonus ponderosae]|nr:hypothetical protein HUJ05_003791 [Dendroctonus ponderosae]